MSNALSQMGLSATATPKEVRDRWIEIAKVHHPDKGGSVEQFQKMKDVYTSALDFAKLPRTCTDCGGAGRTHTKNGFHTTYSDCRTCKSSGKLALE